MIEDFFMMAVRNLKRRRLRSWLTMLGIFISVAIIFILVSLSIGLQASIQEQFREFGTDKFFIEPKGQLAGAGTGGAVQLTQEDVDVVDRVSGVRDYSYWIASSAKIEYKDQIRYFQVIGLPADRTEVFIESGFWKVEDGRMFRSGDSGDIAVGAQYKYNNIFERPTEVGDKFEINGQEFEVKAIMESVGSPPDDRLILMPEEDFRALFNLTSRIDQITVQVNEGEDIRAVADRVEKRLRSSRDVDEKTQDFRILTPEAILDTVGNVLNIITAFLLGVAAISLLVGSIGIANTMYTSVLERTKEIGVMKAVGARNSDVLTMFTIESGLIGLVGGIVGVIFGIVIVKAVEYIAAVQLGIGFLKAALPWYLILGCLAFSFIVGAVSGTWPAWRASKIKPVDALRYE